MIASSPATAALTRVLVVENDIDPVDLRDVVWALGSRAAGLRSGHRETADLSPCLPSSLPRSEPYVGAINFHNALVKDAADRRGGRPRFEAVYPEAVKSRVRGLLGVGVLDMKTSVRVFASHFR